MMGIKGRNVYRIEGERNWRWKSGWLSAFKEAGRVALNHVAAKDEI